MSDAKVPQTFRVPTYSGDSSDPMGRALLAAFSKMMADASKGKTVVIGSDIDRAVDDRIIECGELVSAVDRPATPAEIKTYLEYDPDPAYRYYRVKFGHMTPGGVDWLYSEEIFAQRFTKMLAHEMTGNKLVVGSTNPFSPGDRLLSTHAGAVVIVKRSTRDEYLKHATPAADRRRCPFYYECAIERTDTV